ncbi:hypothetical protein ABZ570_07945 [Micromonospora sp. NPDC007271]|uniref:hypothetical protein n=1 Tax=Micromonospora sp. NPDC007271 TaxID=3154587 RepID=UPI0033CAB8FA
MTDNRPTSPPPRQPGPPSGSGGEPGTAPEWLRQPPADTDARRGDRLRSRLRRHAGLIATVLVLLTYIGVVGGAVLVSMPEAGGRPVPYAATSRPAGEHGRMSASPPPASPPSASPPPASPSPAAISPFDGTPAATFPQGQAGIVLPVAKRTGPFTEKQVAAALAKVRKAVVTARLDRRFMTRKDPEPLVRQFAPDARANQRKAFTSGTSAAYATRLAPGARLTADQPRVKGRITYRATKDADGIRILAVTTNLVWAYAFRTSSAVPGDGLVVVHDMVVWSVPHPDDVDADSNGLWIEDAHSYASNIDCAAFDKGLLRPGAPDHDVPADPEQNEVFDPDRILDIEDTC